MSNHNKQYSKLKGIGGHVVWTDREVMQVPLYYEGVAVNEREFAIIKIAGRDVLLRSMLLEARVPISRNSVSLTLDLYTGENSLVVGSTITLPGSAPFSEVTFGPAIAMPAGSFWKAHINFNDSFADFAPEGLTLTYRFSYANGPVTNAQAAFTLVESGVGFWTIGDDFIVT